MSSSPHFRARLVFFDESAGGRLSPPLPGYRPQIELGEELTSCTITAKDTAVFEFNTPHIVELSLMFPDRYLSFLEKGDQVVLREGSRKVGEGTILELLAGTD